MSLFIELISCVAYQFVSLQYTAKYTIRNIANRGFDNLDYGNGKRSMAEICILFNENFPDPIGKK